MNGMSVIVCCVDEQFKCALTAYSCAKFMMKTDGIGSAIANLPCLLCCQRTTVHILAAVRKSKSCACAGSDSAQNAFAGRAQAHCGSVSWSRMPE
jgi:hypothetical protein